MYPNQNVLKKPVRIYSQLDLDIFSASKNSFLPGSGCIPKPARIHCYLDQNVFPSQQESIATWIRIYPPASKNLFLPGSGCIPKPAKFCTQLVQHASPGQQNCVPSWTRMYSNPARSHSQLGQNISPASNNSFLPGLGYILSQLDGTSSAGKKRYPYFWAVPGLGYIKTAPSAGISWIVEVTG